MESGLGYLVEVYIRECQKSALYQSWTVCLRVVIE